MFSNENIIVSYVLFVCNEISILQFLCYLIITEFQIQNKYNSIDYSIVRYVTIFIQLNKLPLYCYWTISIIFFVCLFWIDEMIVEKYTLCYSIQIIFHLHLCLPNRNSIWHYTFTTFQLNLKHEAKEKLFLSKEWELKAWKKKFLFKIAVRE